MVNSDTNRINPRADSFTFYMNTVGSTLLENLLPKQKLSQFGHKFVRPGFERDHHIARNAINNKSVQNLSNVFYKKERKLLPNNSSVQPIKVSKLFNQSIPTKKARQSLSGVFPQFDVNQEAKLNYCASTVEKSPRRSIQYSRDKSRSLSRGKNLSQRSQIGGLRSINKSIVYSPNITTKKLIPGPVNGLLMNYGYDDNVYQRPVMTNHGQRRNIDVNGQLQVRKVVDLNSV